MLRENQYARGYDPAGMDNRIYRQQILITRLYEKSNKDHLKVFSEVNRKALILQTPVYVCSSLSALCSYLIICLYCTLGAFPVGSVIKYLGYFGNLT